MLRTCMFTSIRVCPPAKFYPGIFSKMDEKFSGVHAHWTMNKAPLCSTWSLISQFWNNRGTQRLKICKRISAAKRKALKSSSTHHRYDHHHLHHHHHHHHHLHHHHHHWVEKEKQVTTKVRPQGVVVLLSQGKVDLLKLMLIMMMMIWWRLPRGWSWW